MICDMKKAKRRHGRIPDAAELAVVQRMLDEGATVPEVSQRVGISRHTLYNYVRIGILTLPGPRRGKDLPGNVREEIKRMLLEKNLTVQEIKDRLGLASRCPIYYLRDKLLKDEIREAGEFHPVVMKKKIDRRCPEHGKVRFWPCVICEAEAAKRRAKACG